MFYNLILGGYLEDSGSVGVKLGDSGESPFSLGESWEGGGGVAPCLEGESNWAVCCLCTEWIYCECVAAVRKGVVCA